IGVAALVALQIVWAGDWYFSGSDRIANAMTLIRSSMEWRASSRFASYRSEYLAMSRALPRNAVVLLHEQHSMLGIDRPVLLDSAGFQGVVDYRNFRTMRDVYDRFRELGVTHILWAPGAHPPSYRQEQILFDLFVYPLFEKSTVYGGSRLSPMPEEAPASS